MEQKEAYSIHPSIGIGRLGNSHDAFYLAPETIGGLPIEADVEGNPLIVNGKLKSVTDFKDPSGRIKRQAATFKIYKTVGGKKAPLDLSDSNVEKIEWTVHVANKKAAWWNYVPLLGDLMFGRYNSYETWENTPKAWNLKTTNWTQLRNSGVEKKQRQSLIIDPGPRSLDQPGKRSQFNAKSAPKDYKHVSFPDPNAITQGLSVQTLGEMRTDSKGNLLVLGAYGRAGGSESITGFGGGDTWNDDIADGPVTAKLYLKGNSKPIELKAWVVIGSPKFAPELVNISTWSDVVADLSIKYKDALPEAYNAKKWAKNDGWNPDYLVNYDKDIQPFLNRIADYQWVATVPSMTAFIRPAFDVNDASEANRPNREKFLSYFRKPSAIRPADEKHPPGFTGGQNGQLFSDYSKEDPANGIPLMPLNSGTNSVRNNLIDKFSVLTDTQYYALQQWAKGKFSSNTPGLTIPDIDPLDEASIGNCVGEPMCPGIEVTWSVRNPIIYDAPYVIKHRHNAAYYLKHGLSAGEDECEPVNWNAPTIGLGCEPGDLTKRMAIPWQADFYDCSVQMINFDDPNIVKNPNSLIPVPPTYYAYWWPPQSPWNVISGATTVEEQKLAGVPAGLQVMYSRGMNSFSQMISSWKYLGFILNQNKDENYGRQYPYFVEKERNHNKFGVASVGVGNVSSFVTNDDSNYLPAWFLLDEDPEDREEQSLKLYNGPGELKTYHMEKPKPIIAMSRRPFGH